MNKVGIQTVFCGVVAILTTVLCQAQSYTISTIAGGGPFSFGLGDGGPATKALLSMPGGLAFDSIGDLYIADTNDHVIREITLNGIISTVAGTQGVAGYSSGITAATKALLSSPTGIVIDATGNLYISDSTGNYILKVLPSGNLITYAGGGTATPTSLGDGAPATNASLNLPMGLALDGSGNLYIADYADFRVRKVDSTGKITTVAGNGTFVLPPAGNGDGGLATNASVAPYGLAVDSTGNLYIADYGYNRIRKVTASGIITTVAGGGTGTSGLATGVALSHPQSIAVDTSGNIYIADTGNQAIRLVTTDGKITTIAGTGQIGSTGDGGYAAGATLNNPVAIALGKSGTIYIADNANTGLGFGSSSVGDYRVRLLTPATPQAAPTITSMGVVPVYSSSPVIQPGSWISIYGTNFAGAATTWNGTFPTSLGGVSVTINSKPAYLWYVSPTQINLQAPDDTATGTVPVVVTSPAGSVSSTVTLSRYGPSLSLLDSKHAIGIVMTPGAPGNSGAGYDLIGPAGGVSPTTRPVKAGETLVLFGVGFGPTTPPVPAGALFSGSAPATNAVTLTIGGVAAKVTYAGIVQAGLFQFNVVVPSAGTGDQTLSATVGGVNTPANVAITLQ